MILVFNKSYKLERTVENLGELESDWLVPTKELEDALKEMKPVNNRYLISDTELPQKLSFIIKQQEDALIELMGGNLDESDEQVEQLVQELDKLKTSEAQLRKQTAKLRDELTNKDELLKSNIEKVDKLADEKDKLEMQVIEIGNMNNEYQQSLEKAEWQIQLLRNTLQTIDMISQGKEAEPSEINKTDGNNEPVDVEEQQEPEDTKREVKTGIVTKNEAKNEAKNDYPVRSKSQPSPKIDPPVYKEDKKESEPAKRSVKEDLSKESESVKVQSERKTPSASLDWVGKMASKEFPLRENIGRKKIWHAADVSNSLSSPKNVITEADLDYIVATTFKDLGYRKEKPNPKIFTPVETVLFVFAVNATVDKKYTGLSRFDYAVRVLYDDWYRHRDVIQAWIDQQ